MKFRFINSWKSSNKQADKFELKWRIKRLTILEISTDKSRGEVRVMLFNFGIAKIG
jgi:hypothetical protein